MSRGVAPIENPHRIFAVIIEEVLFPLGPIDDSQDFARRRRCASMGLQTGQVGKGQVIATAREIGNGGGVYVPMVFLPDPLPDRPNRQRLYFRPGSPDHRHQGPIHADLLDRWPLRRGNVLANEPFDFGRLLSHQGCSRLLGPTPCARFRDLHAVEPTEIARRQQKRHPGPQMDQVLDQAGGERTGQEA